MPGPLEKDTCRDYVVPRLEAAGWQDKFVEQYRVTDGKIVPLPRPRRRSRAHRRDEPLRADYVLEYEPNLPVAVVEAKRARKLPGDGLQQAKRYAEMLRVPLAYSTNGKGIVEHDYDTGRESVLTVFPTPADMWLRYRAWKGLTEEIATATLLLPFNRDLRLPDGRIKEPRYYQRAAIEAALTAILDDNRNRVLLTLATGTGKTFVALQIVWKLWQSRWREGRKPRFLYLADRNILVDQPISREFKPVFGDAIWKVQGEAKTGREIYFALYQSLADSGGDLGVFRDYPSDYFDLVIVDECHRGSARGESTWRSILEHFSPAVQLGMTATPLRDENRDTYQYFGDPIYTYTLSQGIEGGFLAPYRVRRVVLSPDAAGWSPSPGQLDRFGREIPEGVYETKHFERVVSLLIRTDEAAKHLTDYLKRTDRMAKTIVFCVDSDHADQMRQSLNNANADLARQYPNYAVRIVSDEGDVGRQHLGDFADPERETPVIATTSQLLSTGVDLPTVRNIVLFKPIGSMVDFKQIIGRGTRLYPDDDKLTFEIIDYTGATALFEDPEFDGPPEEPPATEEIDETGEVVSETDETESESATGGDGEPGSEAESDEVEDEAIRKFYVDEGMAYVVAEGVYLPNADTGRLRLTEYSDYVAEVVRRLYATRHDLHEKWSSGDGRSEVTEALLSRGIDLTEAAERLGLVELDPLDLLVYVAWNGDAITRRERSIRLRTKQKKFLESFSPEARSVLDDLLEKYAEHGITQLDDLRVLEVPPLDRHGSPVDIAFRFGGRQELQAAVERLEELLYAS
ncbi:EcoAI/FtnUII family type I restriction enzme subunit R [Mycobacterium sp. IS-1556]|uniref:EcoAI/FtnUII family type I restriction enzme subunit R n=1 Tax=Mycobacterium sp. IS-1556 TaxID=1772276 RepID=UPI0012E3CA0A|nr:DEAD/DEAH box helicase family protein [Mycobacterium sp. IS-1556]